LATAYFVWIRRVDGITLNISSEVGDALSPLMHGLMFEVRYELDVC
jgi:hypothetical protein